MPPPKRQRPLWAVLVTGATALWLAALVFLPADYMVSTVSEERSTQALSIGDDREQEAYEQANPPHVEATDGERPLSRWIAERNLVARLWGTLATYRISLLTSWMLALGPILAAIVVDAYCVREVRKYRFVAQSPLRHKVAARTGYALLATILAIILLPVAMPAVAIPIVLLGVAGSFWAWAINLQKRL